jgi:MFS family permease
MKLTEAVGALRERRFAWYFAARTTTSIGSAMTSVALAFAVLHISDDPGALAQVLAAHMAAMVIFLLLGGVVADRYSRTVIMQTSHALTFLTQGWRHTSSSPAPRRSGTWSRLRRSTAPCPRSGCQR